MPTTFQPTHRITRGARRSQLVALVDGAAYTEVEWQTFDRADYELHEGEWLFQGEPFTGTVEKL